MKKEVLLIAYRIFLIAFFIMLLLEAVFKQPNNDVKENDEKSPAKPK